MKLEITKERILEAASKCSTAKETLKTLFPEVFEEDKYLNLHNAYIHQYLTVEPSGPMKGKAFYLTGMYNWQLITEQGDQYLIPTKK